MKEYILNKSKSTNLHAYFQEKRLLQIFWAVEFTLLLVTLQRLLLDEYFNVLLTSTTMVILIGVHKLIKKNKVTAATTLLLSIVTAFVTYFIWKHAGIYDETLFAYPCILIIAAMVGDRKLFTGLVIFMSLSILLNGMSNQLLWHVNPQNSINVHSAMLVLLIILLTSYTIWVMSADFQILIKRISHENTKVIESKQEVEKLLHHDILTGLPNRMMAKKIFNKALASAQRSNDKVCMMFIDLDHFKLINDGLGHKAGDELLIELSKRFKNTVRESDSVCRFAGDEFVIILESITCDERLTEVAQDIITAIQKPYYYQSNELICSCSIGISVSPSDGTNFDSIIQCSDTAMYHSKSIGGNSFHFFNAEMNSQGHDYLNVVTDLRKALKEQNFLLHFQPKIDLIHNKIIGAEALVRWQHPEKGLVFPDDFISQAERSGLIVEIGQWVLEQACFACKQWIERGFTDFSIAVNVSSQQFKRGDFAKIVETALQKSGLAAKHLEIEMTESLLIDNSEQLKKTVKYLSQLGVSFSIDDFGTGYSNLSYLKSFEIEVLKIDRSFLKNIESNPTNKALVTAIIQMAKGLSLATVAEGIENQEIAQMLSEMDCDYAQGYYWSKALTDEEFIELATNYENAPLSSEAISELTS